MKPRRVTRHQIEKFKRALLKLYAEHGLQVYPGDPHGGFEIHDFDPACYDDVDDAQRLSIGRSLAVDE